MLKRDGYAWVRGEERRRYPSERRNAEGNRKDILESVGRVWLSIWAAAKRWRVPSGIGGKRCVAGGAKKSDRDPVSSRAMVDVNATVVTCVDGRPAGGGACGE